MYNLIMLVGLFFIYLVLSPEYRIGWTMVAVGLALFAWVFKKGIEK